VEAIDRSCTIYIG